MANDKTQFWVTGQQAVGSVFTTATDTYALVIWCGTDASRTVNVCTSPITDTGVGEIVSSPTVLKGFAGAGLAGQQVNGPTFVYGLDRTTGYLAYVNASQQVVVVNMSLGQNATGQPQWQVGTVWATFSTSKAQGAPTMQMTLQNGAPVLSLIWQDGVVGSILLAQLEIGDPSPNLKTRNLGQQCLGAPSLSVLGHTSFLAWTGTNNDLNLALDPVGGVNFQFDDKLTLSSSSAGFATQSTYGPSFVPFGPNKGIIVWSAKAGNLLWYAQLSVNHLGAWVINPLDNSFCEFTDEPMTGGPYAHAMIGRDPDTGETWPAIAVAFSNNLTDLVIASMDVDLSPVPIQQMVIA